MTEENKANISDDSVTAVPEWINTNYIENFLKIYFKDDSIQILKYYPSSATKNGENYVSDITRILVEYEKFNHKYNIAKYIIKSSIENEAKLSKIIKDYQPFEDELLMYSDVLPDIQEMLKNINDLNMISVFPQPIYCDFERSAIVLEDLTAINYKLANRIKGLNKEHAKLALKKLAIFHASSFVLNELSPGRFKKFDHGIINRHTSGLHSFFCNSIRKICDILETFGEEYVNYSKKIRKLIPYWIEKEQKCYDPKPDQLNVLAHGDFWTNNIMYKYNDNLEPTDAILIDFQFSVWSSPALDLHYFFNSSLAGLPNIIQMEDLLKFYYYEFVKNLKFLNYNSSKIPNLEKFFEQFWANGFHALQSCFIHKGVAFLEDNSDASPDALFCEGEKSERFQRAMVNNKRIQDHWKILVPYFDKKGLLDL